ncbi:hypothetical protein [Nitrosomonas ureae]
MKGGAGADVLNSAHGNDTIDGQDGITLLSAGWIKIS